MGRLGMTEAADQSNLAAKLDMFLVPASSTAGGTCSPCSAPPAATTYALAHCKELDVAPVRRGRRDARHRQITAAATATTTLSCLCSRSVFLIQAFQFDFFFSLVSHRSMGCECVIVFLRPTVGTPHARTNEYLAPKIVSGDGHGAAVQWIGGRSSSFSSSYIGAMPFRATTTRPRSRKHHAARSSSHGTGTLHRRVSVAAR